MKATDRLASDLRGAVASGPAAVAELLDRVTRQYGTGFARQVRCELDLLEAARLLKENERDIKKKTPRMAP